MKLILKKCAFDCSPIAVVFFEKKVVGWVAKCVTSTKTVEFFFNTENAPVFDDAKYFIEAMGKIEIKKPIEP